MPASLIALLQSIEPKVKASGSGAAVAGLVVWILNHYWMRQGVPPPVSIAVYVITPGVVALVAGYYRKVVPPKQPSTARTTTAK